MRSCQNNHTLQQFPVSHTRRVDTLCSGVLSGRTKVSLVDRSVRCCWVHDAFAGSVVIQEFYLANEGWYPGLKGLRDSRLCSTASGHEFFTTIAGAEI